MTKVIEAIARSLEAIKTCKERGNEEWEIKHTERLNELVDRYLPHGSGLDGRVEVILEESNPNKIVISADFHHLDNYGMYDGWTEHKVIVRPRLAFGFDIRVTGRNRNDIKDYLTEIFYDCLGDECRFG